MRKLLILYLLLLPPMLIADDYVDDAYYWPSSRMEAEYVPLESEYVSHAHTVQQPDTTYTQPNDSTFVIRIHR